MAQYEGFISGDPWIRCGVCSQRYRSSQLRLQWDKVYACKFCWDPRPNYLDPIPTKENNKTDIKARGNPADIERIAEDDGLETDI